MHMFFSDGWSRDDARTIDAPWFLTVCLDVRNMQPASEKVHQIIARTALFVSQHGGQSEIVLRVKQGDNPKFGFLMPDHHLHGYYRYLVDHPQLMKVGTDSAVASRGSKSGSNDVDDSSGALSLLGSAYGTGEDDEGMVSNSSQGMDAGNDNAASAKTIAKKEQEKSTSNMLEERQNPTAAATIATPKEKSVLNKKNQVSSESLGSAQPDKVKNGVVPALTVTAEKVQGSLPSISLTKQVILEPPSFIKRAMEKIVEFILRNGKEFEAILIEQDKTIGRFPFLLPSNQYNPYYLKILEEAHEAKLQGKSSSNHRDDARGNEGSKRRSREAGCKDSITGDRSSAEPSEKPLYDQQNKEKFKMVIGGPQKDTDKQTRQVGVSADEAAAIVLAATRGVSPANAPPLKASKEMLGSGRVLGNEGRASSIGSFSSLHGADSISKLTSKNEASTSIASDGQKGNSGTIDDVWIAQTIAKTAALAASREADSSEASMSREQKLKAERLRRAKMFAAIIKSGGNITSDLDTSSNPPNAPAGPSPADTTNSGVDSDPVAKEREGSSVPIEKENLDRTKQEKDTDYDGNKEHKYRKKQHLESSDEDREDTEERHRHSRKRHQSEHLSRAKESHKHRRRHSSKDTESKRHHHKHDSSSEDEQRHKISQSRHRHRDHHNHSEEDEEVGKIHKHRRHRHSSSRRKEEPEGDGVSLDHSEVSLSLADHHEHEEKATHAAQSSDAPTEIPDELRAKIRAMLRETL